jgi:hypothetical protein
VSDGGEQRAEDDRPRLLAQRSELGYVDRLNAALHHEPEAVSSAYQAKVTLDAQRRDRAQRVGAWHDAHLAIRNAIVVFRATCRVDHALANALRVVERQCVAIERKIEK